MTGRALAGGRGWNPKSAAAHRDAFAHLFERACRIDERDLADRDQTTVAAAERTHGAVVSADAAVNDVEVARRQILRGGEGREHELLGEAEIVQRAAALLGIEG